MWTSQLAFINSKIVLIYLNSQQVMTYSKLTTETLT